MVSSKGKNSLYLKLLLASAFILVCVSFFYGNSVQAQAQTGSLKYENSELGLSFQYPTEWIQVSSPDDCITKDYCVLDFIVLNESGSEILSKTFLDIDAGYEEVVHYNFSPKLKLSVTNLRGESPIAERCNCKNLTDYVAWDYIRQDRLDKNNGLTWIFIRDNQTIIANNHTAWQMEQTDSDKTIRTYTVWAVEGNQGYRFDYIANSGEEFYKSLNQFKQMLNSIVFIPVQDKLYNKYENEKVRIHFEYPSHWTVQNGNFTKNENCDYYCTIYIDIKTMKDRGAFVVIMPEKLGDNKCFLVFCSSPSLKEIMKTMYPKSFAGRLAHLIRDNETMVNNRPWWQIEYSGGHDQNNSGLEMFTVDDKNVFYEINYEADKSVYKNHLSEFMNLIKSITFKDLPISTPSESQPKEEQPKEEQPSFMK